MHDAKNKSTTNSRNGKSKKTITSEYGEMEIQVPRDRNGEFEPMIVKKHQSNVTGIEDQIIAMYAKGVSTRDIQDHLNRSPDQRVAKPSVARRVRRGIPGRHSL